MNGLAGAVTEMSYNTLDEVLAELDKRWEDSNGPNKNGSDYNLSRIEFRGFNFSIAAMWSRYRIETLNGDFIMNASNKLSITDFIHNYHELGNKLIEVIK